MLINCLNCEQYLINKSTYKSTCCGITHHVDSNKVSFLKYINKIQFIFYYNIDCKLLKYYCYFTDNDEYSSNEYVINNIYIDFKNLDNFFKKFEKLLIFS